MGWELHPRKDILILNQDTRKARIPFDEVRVLGGQLRLMSFEGANAEFYQINGSRHVEIQCGDAKMAMSITDKEYEKLFQKIKKRYVD